MKKRLTIGIFAHVDGGKTTLSEALLNICGVTNKLGRVDHQDAYLDNYWLEKSRGITIFSKQAIFEYGNVRFTLIDTPGHTDFASEAQKVAGILDYAILIVDAKSGVRPYTKNLWNLLQKYKIPVFVFVNKMDIAGIDKAQIRENILKELSSNVVDMDTSLDLLYEELSLCDEKLLEEFLNDGRLGGDDVSQAIFRRKVFPCYFGSALKLDGVEKLLEGLNKYCITSQYGEEFSGRVFKIEYDDRNTRLTHIKITGGKIKLKDLILPDEKINGIRLYSGVKYQELSEAEAGQVVAITGLKNTYWGQALGKEESDWPIYEGAPFSYEMILPDDVDAARTFKSFKPLVAEDPTLNMRWDQVKRKIYVNLDGEVKQEILKSIVKERFGIDVAFGKSEILYKETIADTVEGVGHYEPLKHFAEVHLLLEPMPMGTGVIFESHCSEDVLDKNWQRLIMTHLNEKEHLGVLTKSPITDIKISILTGKAHQKHTEGGDFRQATYRAVRNGLMRTKSKLLEPYFNFTLSVPTASIGRAMMDIKSMSGQFESPQNSGEFSILKGTCPAATMQNYGLKVATYTKGQGELTYEILGYRECHNADEVVKKISYDASSDVENSPDSIFCIHGAGVNIKWNEVFEYMSLPYVYKNEESSNNDIKRQNIEKNRKSNPANDAELQHIFEKTYGTKKETKKIYKKNIKADDSSYRGKEKKFQNLPELLIVDGYNIIFSWEELKKLGKSNIDIARETFIEIMQNYQGYKRCKLMIVFDGYKVGKNIGSVNKYGDVEVVYTKEKETADSYIEKITYELSDKYNIMVATSDALEQSIIFGHGAMRLSARELKKEVEQSKCEIDNIIRENNRKNSRNYIEL